MVRPYSLDLRERAVAAVADGATCREVAALFDVAVSSVVKWSGRKRATVSAAAKPMGGRRFHKLEAERGWLMSRIAEKPDITMRELAAELAERGIFVSHVSVWNLVRRQEQSYKKACSQASRIGLTLRGAGCAGAACRPCSIPSGSSSSTKNGRRPTWRLCGDGAGAESGSRPSFRTGTGKR